MGSDIARILQSTQTRFRVFFLTMDPVAYGPWLKDIIPKSWLYLLV